MSHPKQTLPFAKYQGLGNDFILIDCRPSTADTLVDREEAVRMCERHFGVGADGAIFILSSAEADARVRIYNADGSEPEMCGNGIRCVAKYLAALQGAQASTPRYTISTLAGLIRTQIQPGGGVCVDMGPPQLRGPAVPTTLPTDASGRAVRVPLQAGGGQWDVTCVSMGNPHAVTFVDDLDAIDLGGLGPAFETHPAFPARVNAEFVQVLSRGHLKMRVWERGAGPTLACGTGACAAAVAAVLEGRADCPCKVTLPGGDLHIDWQQGGDGRLLMTGDAVKVFDGVWPRVI